MPGGLFLAGGQELTAAFADAHATLLAWASDRPCPVPQQHAHHSAQVPQHRSPARVVFLPTAAAGDGPGVPEYWARRAIAHFQAVGAAQVEAVMFLDPAGRHRRDLLEPISHASVVYLGGGKPHLLRSLLGNSAIWQEIERVYRAGSWLAGTSAGAMVLGELTLVHADARYPQPKAWEPGLNVLPGMGIVPHYDAWPKEDIRDIVHAAPDWLVVVGIDEYTALAGDPRSGWINAAAFPQTAGWHRPTFPIPLLWTVLGRGHVTIRAGGQQRVYHPGDWLVYPAEIRYPRLAGSHMRAVTGKGHIG
jgi:peptidase E